MTKLKGMFIGYRSQTGHLYRAKVRTVHRAGGLAVEPFFAIDEKTGRDTGPFQGGHLVELADTDIIPLPEKQPFTAAEDEVRLKAAEMGQVANARLRAQVAAEIEHAEGMQPAARYTVDDACGIVRGGKRIGQVWGMRTDGRVGLAHRIVALLNQHGEG